MSDKPTKELVAWLNEDTGDIGEGTLAMSRAAAARLEALTEANDELAEGHRTLDRELDEARADLKLQAAEADRECQRAERYRADAESWRVQWCDQQVALDEARAEVERLKELLTRSTQDD